MTIDRDGFDPALDALLRAHSNEIPPMEVDAAILSAAHRAVASAPRNADDGARPRPWRRWMPLAAAATIAAIAFGVLQVAPTDTRVGSPDAGDQPRVARMVPDGQSARDTAAAANGESSSKTVQPAAPPASAPPASAPPSSAPPASAPPASVPVASAPQAFPLQKQQAANALAPSAPAPAAEAAAPRRETAGASVGSLRTDQAAGMGPRSVAEWIARIRALRDEGKAAEAAQALAQFRAAYANADSRLPEDLRAWAGTIKR